MNLVAAAETLLRTRDPGRHIAGAGFWQLFTLLVVGGFFYGAVMGGFMLRPMQMLYSGLKVPILLTASSFVCLPSFFVINTLLGLRDDFSTVVRGIVSAQLCMAVVLASLAPFTALAYLSSSDYPFAVSFNGVMFLLASIASQVQLRRVYRPLVEKDPRHRLARRTWLVLYIFVTIQLAWMLRPFIGWSGMATTFLRDGVWDNAYVVVASTVWRLLGGS